MTDPTHALGSIEPVKPLEWLSKTDGEFTNGHSGRRIMAEAATSFGRYHIELGAVGWYCLYGTLSGTFAGPFGAEADARAAAQSDYSTRILSALDSAFIARLEAVEAENARLREVISTASAAEPVKDDAREIIAELVRLADMGFDESLKEPEENGNYAAYERAKRFLSLTSPHHEGGQHV